MKCPHCGKNVTVNRSTIDHEAREAAKARGERYYENPIECAKCGGTTRYTSSDGRCVVCERRRSAIRRLDPAYNEANEAYMRKWREDNPEKIRAYQKKHNPPTKMDIIKKTIDDAKKVSDQVLRNLKDGLIG